MSAPHVVVIGGGISGLAAAYRLNVATHAPRVTVLESSNRLGGKIVSSPFGGVNVDEGPDAFLARVPDAINLCKELGIDSAFISTASKGAFIATRGKLRRLPDGLMLGVPTRLRQVAMSGIVSPLGLARAGLDLVLPDSWNGHDESVGHLISRRMGREVAERLVDPLVGSINASDTFELSAQMSTPQIAEAARKHRSLIMGLRELQSKQTASSGPMFYSFEAGVGLLVDRLVAALTDVDLKTNTAVSALSTDATGRYVITAGGETIVADAVVMATPAHVTSKLVASIAPAAAEILGTIEYASVALVTMAFRSTDIGVDLDGSGLLVPQPEGLLMTAASFGHRKWPHWQRANPDRVVLRISAGRYGDDRAMHLDDDELVDTLAREAAQLLDITGPVLEWRVSRWPSSFPQDRPGHSEVVGRAEAALASAAPGIELTGSSYRGVGIPACIRQGNEAAGRIIDRFSAE